MRLLQHPVATYRLTFNQHRHSCQHQHPRHTVQSDEEAQAASDCRAAAKQLTHSELTAILSILKQHAPVSWPALKRSSLDSKVLRRLIGLEAFVDFAAADFVARGALMRTTADMLSDSRRRYVVLLHENFRADAELWHVQQQQQQGPAGAAEVTAALQKRVKWLAAERDSAWRAVTLAAKGLAGWGSVLVQERAKLLAQCQPGTKLMMLSAVWLQLPLAFRAGAALLSLAMQACI